MFFTASVDFKALNSILHPFSFIWHNNACEKQDEFTGAESRDP